MMTVSRVSRKTTRKTGTAKTWGAMLAVDAQLCRLRWEDVREQQWGRGCWTRQQHYTDAVGGRSGARCVQLGNGRV